MSEPVRRRVALKVIKLGMDTRQVVARFDAEDLLTAGLDEMRRTISEMEPLKPSTRLTQEIVAADVRRLQSKSAQPSTLNPQPEDRTSSRRLLQLKELIPLLRGDRDWIVMKALLTAWSGDFDETEQSIHDAELAGVSVADLRMLCGSVAMHRGDYREAVQHLEQAWKISPTSVAVGSMLIKAYAVTGNWDKSQRIFETLDRLAAKTPEDFLFRSSLEALTDPVKALQTLNEAIRRRPTGIALLHRGSGRASVALDTASIEAAEAAIAEVNAARALLPANAQTIALSLNANLVATWIYEENHLAEKRDVVWRQVDTNVAALQQFPGNQAAIVARAVYLKCLGDDPALFRELRASLTNGMTDYFLEVALYRHGEFQAGLDILQPRPGPAEIGADYMRGYFLVELPDGPQLAWKEFHRLWQCNPPTSDILFIQTTLRLLGRKEEAMDVCRKARERAPSCLPWRKEWYRRLLDYNCGDFSEAELLKAAGASRFNQSETHFYIGLTRLAEGDHSGARDHFRTSLATRTLRFFDYDWSGAF